MLVTAHSDGAIAQRLTTELAEVEVRFATELASDLGCVNQLVAHIERYRGKMLRPTLVLAGGLATAPGNGKSSAQGETGDLHRAVATIAEMAHMATLVHDDILDEARTRRRGPTINQRNGNETAVMLGDFLIARTYGLCCRLDNPLVSRTFAEVTGTVCEGELLQLANRNNWGLDEATYFEIIRRKTASMCGACSRLGAALHDENSPFAEALHEYGQALGIAFQIVDDLLDLTGTEDTVGKTLGRDLQKGKLTLPLIHYLAAAVPEGRQRLLTLIEAASAPDAAEGMVGPVLLQIREMLGTHGSIAYAHRRAARLLRQAKAALGVLPVGPARDYLEELADGVLTRRA